MNLKLMRDAIRSTLYHDVSDACEFSMTVCDSLAGRALERYEKSLPIDATPPMEADDPFVVEAVRLAMLKSALRGVPVIDDHETHQCFSCDIAACNGLFYCSHAKHALGCPDRPYVAPADPLAHIRYHFR